MVRFPIDIDIPSERYFKSRYIIPATSYGRRPRNLCVELPLDIRKKGEKGYYTVIQGITINLPKDTVELGDNKKLSTIIEESLNDHGKNIKKVFFIEK